MRMQAVKAPLELARAFVHLRDLLPEAFARLRLLLVGDGPLREAAAEILSRGRRGRTGLAAGVAR